MIFKFSDEFIVDSSLEPWSIEGIRLGFLGAPGSGKSYGAAVFIEQFLEQGGTLALFQPRAEWHTLREIFPVTIVGGPYLQDIPLVSEEAKLYAEAVVKDGISMVFYTGDIEEEEKLVSFAESFIRHMLRMEETIKRPILLVLEETQEYAPRSSQGHIAPPWVYNRMIKQFKDCFTQGRKLGVNPVCLSQRPQEVNFTIRQLCNLVFYGKFAAQDISYIDKECLKPYRDKGLDIRGDQLLDLQKGQWIAIGPGFARQISIPPVRKTKHGADTPKLEYVAPLTSMIQATVSDLSRRLMEMLEKRGVEQSELEKAKRTIKSLQDTVEDLKRQVGLKEDLKTLFTGKGAEEFEAKTKEVTNVYEARLQDASKRIEELEGTCNEQERTIKVLDERAKGLEKELEVYSGIREAFKVIIAEEAKYQVQKALASMPVAKSGSKLVVDVQEGELEVQVHREKVTAEESSLRGAIGLLILDGALDQWITARSVGKGIRDLGYQISEKNPKILDELMWFTRQRILEHQVTSAGAHQFRVRDKSRVKVKE
jgi:fructose-specific phosphotransferase system component IIB